MDDYHVQFELNEPNAAFLADWGMDFASILSAEYGEAMLKKGTPENVDNWPVGTGPYALQQYKVDSQIRYIANPHYWEGEVPTKHLIFHYAERRDPSGETADQRVPDYSRAVAGTVPGD